MVPFPLILALWGFIILTALDGQKVWVDAHSIFIMRDDHRQCHDPKATAIRAAGGGLCVKESPEEIDQKIKEAK